VGAAGLAAADHQFPDVPTTNTFHDDIAWLEDAGVTGGFPDGTYRPSANVTRGSMAAFLRRLAGGDPAVEPMVDAATVDGQTPAQLGQRWAVVAADGTVARSSGGVTIGARTPGTGAYVVNFGVAVAACSYQATPGLPGNAGFQDPTFVGVVGSNISATSVFVTTANQAGTLTDRGFHIALFC
jgi:hypothetical protein